MQISASSEAKRILRVLRLGCASVDMATTKILAHSVWQRKTEKKARIVRPGRKHQAERRMSQTSSALKKRMAAATTQATTVVTREFTNSPILERLPVNWISGITAKGN